jgi:hypothetical protein
VAKDSSTTLTFEYEGVLDSADDSPVRALSGHIGDDTSYLLYAGRWFPVNAYGINRFTATMNTVPAHDGYRQRESESRLCGYEAAGKELCPPRPLPSPGTSLAFWHDRGRHLQEFKAMRPAWTACFLQAGHQNMGATYATTAVRNSPTT